MKKKKKKAPVEFPEFEILNSITYYQMTPPEFVKHIMVNFNKAMSFLRRAPRTQPNLRELHIRYAEWSRAMNIVIRKIMRDLENMANELRPVKEGEGYPSISTRQLLVKYKLAYSLWWNRTHYVETFRKGFFGQLSDRKNINIGYNNIINMMKEDLTDEEFKARAGQFWELIDKLSKKKELTAQETLDALDGKPTRENKF